MCQARRKRSLAKARQLRDKNIEPCINPRQKKASTWLASAFSGGSIGFCGRLDVVRDKRDEGILLAVGELTKTLQQFAFVQ